MHCNGYLVYYFIANQIALIYWLFWVWDLGFWHYGTMALWHYEISIGAEYQQ